MHKNLFLVQFLKFVEKTAPVAVYTSGKGSSAAGLTASVIRDSSSVSNYDELPNLFMMHNSLMFMSSAGVLSGRRGHGSRRWWSCLHRRV